MRIDRRPRIAALCIAALALAAGAGFALAQTVTVETEVRALVYLHESGTIELGLQHDGETHLPERRFILSRHEPGSWIRSSPVAIAVDAPQPEPVTVQVEVPVEVPVEVIVEVPVAPPASVRPSDHEEIGLACLDTPDADGHSWTWTLAADSEADEDDVDRFDSADAVFFYVQYREWAAASTLEDDPAVYERDQLALSWFAQCASYHGLDPTFGEVVATEPDAWMNESSE